MHKIDETIPGWSGLDKLEILAELAGKVPENGLIVEIGSFCGRSAYAMGMNKKDSTKLLCVDMFIDEWLTQRKVKDYPGSESCFGNVEEFYSFQAFERNTSNVTNMNTMRLVLPYDADFFTFNKKIDLIFIDATHTYDAVKCDIEQWCIHLKDGGVAVFDDYFDMFPGCMQAVDEYVSANNLTLTVLLGTMAVVTG